MWAGPLDMLDVPFYDKEIIEMAARESGFRQGFIEEKEDPCLGDDGFGYIIFGGDAFVSPSFLLMETDNLAIAVKEGTGLDKVNVEKLRNTLRIQRQYIKGVGSGRYVQN